MINTKWQCRISPTLGNGFAGTPNETWGTTDYKDIVLPTVFFGCYGLPDLFAVRQHRGRKAIFWAGTDVTYFINGYWLDDRGEFRLDPKIVGPYLNRYCENWCENDIERIELARFGIDAKVCPSYLGDIKKIRPSYNKSHILKAYISVSGDDFKAYGWDKLDILAKENPKILFYCYGNVKPFQVHERNIILRGRLTQKQMDKEIKKMHYALRLNKHDGFSEIIAKAVMMEHSVISAIKYPFLALGRKGARKWLLQNVNRFPWNSKI